LIEFTTLSQLASCMAEAKKRPQNCIQGTETVHHSLENLHQAPSRKRSPFLGISHLFPAMSRRIHLLAHGKNNFIILSLIPRRRKKMLAHRTHRMASPKWISKQQRPKIYRDTSTHTHRHTDPQTDRHTHTHLRIEELAQARESNLPHHHLCRLQAQSCYPPRSWHRH